MNCSGDFNIIPIGDHCAISMILNELNLRKHSYPFDWNAKEDPINETNIFQNIELLKELYSSNNVDDVVKKYIGDAFENKNKVNKNSIIFPHDSEDIKTIFEKYKRRFIRLKLDLPKKNIFLLLTRNYYIGNDKFLEIVKDLLQYNSNSIVLFISGATTDIKIEKNNKNVIYKYIEYDITKFCEFDYTTFRPSVKKYLSDLLLGNLVS